MEKKKKTAAKAKGPLLNMLNKASKAGMEVNIKSAPVLMDRPDEPTQAISKISMDLKTDTVDKIKNAMYWERMESRAEVVEKALSEYFAKYPEIIRPTPNKK